MTCKTFSWILTIRSLKFGTLNLLPWLIVYAFQLVWVICYSLGHDRTESGKIGIWSIGNDCATACFNIFLPLTSLSAKCKILHFHGKWCLFSTLTFFPSVHVQLFLIDIAFLCLLIYLKRQLHDRFATIISQGKQWPRWATSTTLDRMWLESLSLTSAGKFFQTARRSMQHSLTGQHFRNIGEI